jgi:Rrf2 family protein
MKLSRASSYAVHALAHLAESGNGKLTHAEAIAKARGLPNVFLRMCLLPLEQAGILRSQRGPTGGYRLARQPEAITLLDVIEAVDGPIQRKVHMDVKGKLQAVVDRIAEGTRAELGKVTLASLIGMEKKAKVVR